MIITPLSVLSGEGVLPLEQAMSHLRLDDPANESSDVVAFRDAAIDWVEQHTGHSLQRRAFRWSGDAFAQAQDLLVRPLRSVIGVSYLVADNLVAVPAGGYRIAGDGIAALCAAPWPPVDGGVGCVQIDFEAGHDSNLPAPSALITAVKMLMAHLYRNREATSIGAAISEVPFGVSVLCQPYRSERV
ncbi:head-tail connector protein [Sphingomonas faeni]|uniref:head-tail connector protein n=1 Tax=Sphingomonas faeni TaxID=185950 RepID=UPI0033650F28